jgi:hypothetical protein
MISRRVWIIMSVITLAYVLGIALDVTPLLRGPEDWRWPRTAVQAWDRIWPVAAAWLATLIWTVLVARLLSRTTHRRRWLMAGLLGLMIASGVVQLLALRMERADVAKALFWRATDFYANGYFTVGAGITDIGEFLRQYPALMPGFPLHPQVHPPGLPLIYWLTGQLLAAVPGAASSIAAALRSLDCNNFLIAALPAGPLSGAVAGVVLPVLANALIILCVYHMARSRFGQQAGFAAAALWVLVPSAVIFAGSWSQLYPLLACLTWITFETGLRRRRLAWFVLAGLLLSASTFMELGTAALALFMVIYVLAGYVVERRNPLRDWRFLGTALLAGLAGVFSVWLAYRLFYGVSVNDIVAAMWPIHTGYQFDRLTWMINHPYEFIVFVGLPLAILMLAAWWHAVQRWRRRQAADPLSLSLAVSLVLLSVIDPARDETARTWMIFMPLVVVVAAQWVSADQTLSRRQLVGLWSLLGVQVLTMLLFMRFIALAPVPEVEVNTAGLPPDVVPTAAEFGGVHLQGYRYERTADQLSIDLYWQPRLAADYPYSIFVHASDEQGNLIGQHDTWPQPYLTCWQPGSTYLDRHVLALPPDRAATALQLSIGLYNAETGQRVPAITAGQESDRAILTIPNSP